MVKDEFATNQEVTGITSSTPLATWDTKDPISMKKLPCQSTAENFCTKNLLFIPRMIPGSEQAFSDYVIRRITSATFLEQKWSANQMLSSR